MTPKTNHKADPRGEVLVAILKDKSDFAILQEQGWYRIPVTHAPRRWPPKWLAFYQPKAFKEDAYRVRYYGAVADIQIVKRLELFPNEFISARSEQEYYRVQLKSLEEREQPIPSSRPSGWCSSRLPGRSSAWRSRSMTCSMKVFLKMSFGRN